MKTDEPFSETLKLDIDIRDFRLVKKIFTQRCSFVLNVLKIWPMGLRVYSTKKGYHIYFDIKGVYTSFDICFLQLALGSDYKREVFNFKRFSEELGKEWNVLFKEKYDAKGRLLSRECAEPSLSGELFEAVRDVVNYRHIQGGD
ncbi:hypothetical protein DRQ25_17880 [Candidatus Fermentibacteria bacterium]|nr:MAG: hypothetical protein DRQ25_17880 [Candidatus Fermentibacteria bacterium]